MLAQTDRTLAQRHELKYLVTEGTVAQVKRHMAPFMRPDSFTAPLEGRGYVLSSLYLDSPDIRLCHQTVQGEKNRLKLRVRSYSDAPSDPVYFEIKRRVDQTLMKRRARVERPAAARLIAGGAPVASETANPRELTEFLNVMATYGAVPVARVRYRREAYESVIDEPLRLTFDRDLSFALTSDATFTINGTGWQAAQVNGVIMEVKYTGRYPVWVQRMIAALGIGKQSIPKYVIALTQAKFRNSHNFFQWDGRP